MGRAPARKSVECSPWLKRAYSAASGAQASSVVEEAMPFVEPDHALMHRDRNSDQASKPSLAMRSFHLAGAKV